MSSEEFALSIVQRLRQNGFKAYFCGGCVRDKLLGKIPKDYDVVTEAHPQDIQKIFPNTVAVGAHFGVMMVKYQGQSFEVATFRKDGQYEDGRRPSHVEFSDEIHDIQRRDFTMNGLFFDPQQQQVIDYVGGEQDIQDKVVRTIGEPQKRFLEDHLRLLRAIRFACNLGFSIEQNTWSAIQNLYQLINKVSQERIRDELEKMFTGANPTRAFSLLLESKMLSEIIPETKNYATPHIASIKKMFDCAIPIETFEIALAIVLFHIEDIECSEQICSRLRLSSKSSALVISLLSHREKFATVKSLCVADLKRFLRIDQFLKHLELYKIQCLAQQKNLENYEYCQQKIQEYPPQSLFPKPLMTGNDLKNLGFSPGPIFKEMLFLVEQQQLQGTIQSREDAIFLIQQQFDS